MISNLEYSSPLGKSDHCILKFEYNCYTNIRSKPKTVKLYSRGKYDSIKEELDNKNWREVLKDENSVNHNWNQLLDLIKNLEEKYIPTKVKKQPGSAKDSFPIDKATREKIRKKNILSKKIVHNNDPSVRQEYNKVRNQVKSRVNKLKREFEKNLSKKAKDNPKAIWSYIKSKTKTREGIGDLHIDPDDTKSDKTEDNSIKAKILAEYFSSVFTEEPDEQVPIPEQIQVPKKMPRPEIEEETVIKYLKSLKIDKSPGMDELHPRLLKEIAESIAKPLCIIFNQSVNSKSVPIDWKNAMISAIFKKGNKSVAKNYRPVSLTSVVCKTLEKILRQHITDHMKTNNLFSDKQYGFIAGRSTGLQLLEVIDKWTEALDQGLEIDCIYTDFMKAFDKVPHQRLIAKLKNYNIEENVVGWITSFLNGRQQKVRVNGEESDWKKVTSGIPQGSVLGPLLFVIYINDLPEHVDSDAYLFADDTKVFRIIKNQADRDILQEDLRKLETWSGKWLLKFHPEKCKHMNISKKANKSDESHQYLLLNQNVAKVNEEKDIGVLIDSELTFENHISEKVNKANSIFAVLRRTFKYMSTETFLPLYKTLVRTHLDYASSVWSPYKKKKVTDKIEGVQRRVTKQLPGLKDLSYPERLKNGLPTLAYKRIRGA